LQAKHNKISPVSIMTESVNWSHVNMPLHRTDTSSQQS